MTPSDKILIARGILAEILLDNEDDGDWYGCVEFALKHLREASTSMPPGHEENERWANRTKSPRRAYGVNELPPEVAKILDKSLNQALRKSTKSVSD
jgi:hypothetical protein